MKRILLIVVFGLVGLLGGAAAGMFLAPAPEPDPETETAHGDGSDTSAEHAAEGDSHGETAGADAGHAAPAYEETEGTASERQIDYVKLERQFIVPVIDEGQISSLVVMSLAVEVTDGMSDLVFEEEPKLRDAFLKVFFAHSQSGGFAGDFTRESRMADLRGRLYEAARSVLGSAAKGVLLTNVMRQDS